MNWQHIQYFKIAAEEEHFTRASEKLNITQPALSMAIQALEKELCVPLFIKDGRNVKLTSAGQIFLNFVNQALVNIENGVETIRNDKKEVSGIIDISSLPSFANDILYEVIEVFTWCYPKVNFVINIRGAPETLYMVKENQVDIAFCSETDFSPYNKHLNILEILRDEVVLMTSPEHPLAVYDEISIKECRDHELINYSRSNSYSHLVSSLLKKADVHPIMMDIGSDSAGIIQYIKSRSSMGFLPYSPSLFSSDLKIVKIRDYCFTRGIYMITRKEEYLPKIIKIFRDFLLSIIKNNMTINVLNRDKRLDNAEYYQISLNK